MPSPSTCLHFGSNPHQTMTEGTSQTQDQADRVGNLLRWIQQQEEDARTLYGEDIETLPPLLLLEEMEEVFGGSRLVLAPPGYKPGQNRSTHPMPSPVASSLHRRRRRPLPSTSVAAAAQLSSSAAASAEPSTFVAASTTTEFPAGFSSRPGCRRHQSSDPLWDPTSPSSDSRRERGLWSRSP
ncbi:hypothetical protein GOODEAATRI_032404 [Goodea atripinnis]|uniref:Uncharacterized protein n=1 Tax=Goodea atripinnis TaxID=208336 RepID=A0ABV0NPX0_9TELE